MKAGRKIVNGIKKASVALSGVLLCAQVFADDKLAPVMQGAVKDMLGSSATFWKVFILVDIILAAAMAVKTKNVMVFVGVLGIALIPAFLINTFVFTATA